MYIIVHVSLFQAQLVHKEEQLERYQLLLQDTKREHLVTTETLRQETDRLRGQLVLTNQSECMRHYPPLPHYPLPTITHHYPITHYPPLPTITPLYTNHYPPLLLNPQLPHYPLPTITPLPHPNCVVCLIVCALYVHVHVCVCV